MNRFRLALIVIPVLLMFAGCEKEKEDYILRFYGDAYEDVGYSVAVVSDGYIIAGQLHDIVRKGGLIDNDLSNRNMGVIKTDWNGMVKWKKSVGGKLSDKGSRFVVLDDGSVVCTGTFTDTTSALIGTDAYIVKFSSSGDVIWEKKFGGADNQEGIDILAVQNGFVIIGTTDTEVPPAPPWAGNTAGKKNIFLLSLSSTGDSIYWRDDIGYPNNDVPVSIKEDNSSDNQGGYIILASSEQNISGSMKSNCFMIKVNSLFNTGEAGIFQSSSNEFPSDFELTDDGYFVSGTIEKDGSLQALFRKVKHSVSSSQSEPMVYTINENSISLRALSKYPGGGYIAGGISGSLNGGDMLVFRTDEDGNLVNGSVFTTGGSGTQAVNDITAGDDGWVIAAGMNSFDTNSLITLLKFRY